MNPLQQQLYSTISGQVNRSVQTNFNKKKLSDDDDDAFKKQLVISDSQIIHQQQNFQNMEYSQKRKQQPQPAMIMKCTLFYLYFLQGIILSFASTMPFTYVVLPSYDIMAVFAMATLPFSIKFLTAPFVQKFNHVTYGKRKTWIIIAQLTTSVVIFSSSAYTDIEYAFQMGIILFIAVFCICLQDIALDGLTIKELRRPDLASVIQAVGQTCGLIIGSLLLLKLTSDEFAQSLGLSTKICDASLLFKGAAVLFLVPTILFHFYFKETILDSELQIAQHSFTSVIKYYKVFLNKKSRHFRTSVMFLIWVQGLNFFISGFEYELINAGFSRNTLNSISNITVIPISIASCFLASKLQTFGLLKSAKIIIATNIVVIAMILLVFPQNIISIIFIIFIFDCLNTWGFLIYTMIITSFPITGVTGMYLTMLGCMSNFGRFRAPHTKMLSWFGWRFCSWMGLIYQTGILLYLGRLYAWVQQGDYDTSYLKVQDFQSYQQEDRMLEKNSQPEEYSVTQEIQMTKMR